MFDRRLEIVGHSGGQTRCIRVRAAHPLVFGLQAREGAVRLPIQGRDAH
jgi:hypothetical protein